MPFIKDISKCRRIPKDLQSVSGDESIDEENTELDDDFIKLKEFFNQSKEHEFIKTLERKIKRNLLKRQQNGEPLEPSSKIDLPKVDYPDPLPKMERKKTRASELNSVKKSDHGGHSKSKPRSKPSKKMEDPGKTTKDGINNNPSASFNRKSPKPTGKDKKPTKSDKKVDPGGLDDDDPIKWNKWKGHDIPSFKSDRDLSKGEVEGMIRNVLRLSRMEGGGRKSEDVSLGETDSSPDEEELDLGKDPEMSSTPDDVSGEASSDEEDENHLY